MHTTGTEATVAKYPRDGTEEVWKFSEGEKESLKAKALPLLVTHSVKAGVYELLMSMCEMR